LATTRLTRNPSSKALIFAGLKGPSESCACRAADAALTANELSIVTLVDTQRFVGGRVAWAAVAVGLHVIRPSITAQIDKADCILIVPLFLMDV